jgi:hypothetical protein
MFLYKRGGNVKNGTFPPFYLEDIRKTPIFAPRISSFYHKKRQVMKNKTIIYQNSARAVSLQI